MMVSGIEIAAIYLKRVDGDVLRKREQRALVEQKPRFGAGEDIRVLGRFC